MQKMAFPTISILPMGLLQYIYLINNQRYTGKIDLVSGGKTLGTRHSLST
jgi:hypothetical protein